jgi:hypothetical protein
VAENETEFRRKSVIVEDLESEDDKSLMLQLLNGRKKFKGTGAESVRARELARMFVDKTVGGIGGNTVYLQSRNDAVMHALIFSGFNSRNILHVDEEVAANAVKELLPKAMGDSAEYPLYNSDIQKTLLFYLEDPSKFKMNEKVKASVDGYLTDDKKQILLSRAFADDFEHDFDKKKIEEVSEDLGVTLLSPEELSEKVDGDSAKLSDDVVKSEQRSEILDSELEANKKHQQSIEMEALALQRINAIMERNRDDGWAERTVKDKATDWSLDKVGDFFRSGKPVYPDESIFSNSIAKLDAAGRAEQEFVTFGVNPLAGFKATVKNANQPDDVYSLIANKAILANVKYPYIKSTFRDPSQAETFTKKSLQALVDAGYDIDNIRVQKHLEGYLNAFRSELALSSITEAPEELVHEKENPDPENKHQDPDYVKFEERIQGMSDEERLAEGLKQLNEPLISMQDSMKDPEKPMSFSDFKNEDLVEVLKYAPLLKDINTEQWDTALKQVGLIPRTRNIVESVEAHFDSLLRLADPNVDTPKGIKSRQAERLVAAKDVLIANNPERADDINRVIEGIGGEKPKNTNNHVNDVADPDATSPTEGPQNEQPSFDESPNNSGEDEKKQPSQKQKSKEQESQDLLVEMPSPVLQDDGYLQSLMNDPESQGKNVNDDDDFGFNMDITDEFSQEKVEGGVNSVKSEGVNEVPQSQTPIFQRDKWESIVNKDMSELSENDIRQCHEICQIVDAKAYSSLAKMQPNDNWSSEDLMRLRNAVETIGMVTAFTFTADDIPELVDSEKLLFSKIPEDLLPEGLKEEQVKLAKELNKEQEKVQIKEPEEEIERPAFKR